MSKCMCAGICAVLACKTAFPSCTVFRDVSMKNLNKNFPLVLSKTQGNTLKIV